MKGYRIFVLGAGFSHPAGLPLGRELFQKVRKRARAQFGVDNALAGDLSAFIDYKRRCDGAELTADEVDFEEFLSHLDIEHFLGLRGSDTWSSEGNQGQIMVKRLIGRIIHENTPARPSIPELYLRFAEGLETSDIVLTFNYDILLERALDQIGKPYRLFLYRYSEIGFDSNTVDSSQDEVVILKLHGSVDWFDRSNYEIMLKSYKEYGIDDQRPRNRVFANPDFCKPEPILEGPRRDDDPLLKMHRIRYPGKYYSLSQPRQPPWILSPSHSKILYSSTVQAFWDGLGKAGGMNLGVVIIGFSMPEHDEYVRQSIYSLVLNYQEVWWNDDFFGAKKSKLKLVDHRTTPESEDTLRNRYRFINWDRADVHLSGFNHEAIGMIFENDCAV